MNRATQHAFDLNISPIRYLITCRLNAVGVRKNLCGKIKYGNNSETIRQPLAPFPILLKHAEIYIINKSQRTFFHNRTFELPSYDLAI